MATHTPLKIERLVAEVIALADAGTAGLKKTVNVGAVPAGTIFC